MGLHIRTGSLDRLVDIQQRAITQDAVGGQSMAWTTLLSVYAKFLPMSAQQVFMAQQLGTKISHEITVEWNPIFADPVVNKAYRIRYTNGAEVRIFQVQGSTNEDERDEVITFRAFEGLTQG